ncbi:carboxymuconolactone decarboxylase family protein [Endozoicomonadaceae bacterium StTr2]
MSRIPTPTSIDTAPEGAKASLRAVNNLLGSVPNLFRIVSNSPQTLEGYLGLNGALGYGSLSVRVREGIAVAVAEINGCDYCLAAHNYLGAQRAKLSPAEIEASRRGTSSDAKVAVAIEFAVKVTQARGKVDDADVQAVREAGYSDAEIVEIVGHVAMNTLTNYLNEVLGTEVDFPPVKPL